MYRVRGRRGDPRTSRARAAAVVVCTLVALVGAVRPAHAEIVKLTNGRTIVVDYVSFEGDQVMLSVRGGGEIRMPRTVVDEVLPDEVPYARAVALEALASSRAAAATRLHYEILFAMVDRVADRMGVPRGLAHAVIRVESNYDVFAISSKGAMGLMQLMPATARQYGVGDPFDAEQNLEAGLRHLRYLLDRMSLTLALAAYNAGEGAVARYRGIPPYRETQNYVRRILDLYGVS